ncbi:MAG: hypothetical protein ABR991_00370 [Terracidiphilus sp.]|jgi:hypothetical protein
MAKWIETSYFRANFGWEVEERGKVGDEYTLYNFVREALDGKLNNLVDYCNKNQYEIKGVIPLTNSLSHTHSETRSGSGSEGSRGSVYIPPITNHWGIGYGYGLSAIIGFVALLQRQTEISDEEYASRIKSMRTEQ